MQNETMKKTHRYGLALALILPGVLSASEPRKPAVPPNIIVFMPDDLASAALGCYGNQVIKTPAFDRLARGGMRFENAFTTNSYCTPARATLLTGKYSHKNGTLKLNETFNGGQQTYPKVLQQAGYQTALFGKWHLGSQPTGFEYYCVFKSQGGHWNTTVYETGEKWIPWSPTSDEWREGGRILPGNTDDGFTELALAWLKGRDPNKPFCLLLHPKSPHGPYQPATRYKDYLAGTTVPEPVTLQDDYAGRTPKAVENIMISNRLAAAPRFLEKLTKDERATMTRAEITTRIYQEHFIKKYYQLVKGVDDNLARLLDFLDANALTENTIVLCTTDNGFFMGEHGFFDKMWMYEPSIHVPLIVRYPPLIKPAAVNPSLVSHIDFAPTLLDLAGLQIPAEMQGKSLKPVLDGSAAKVNDSFYYHLYMHTPAIPEIVGVRTDRYKLIGYPGMKEAYQWELFDLSKDSGEMRNLYNHPDYQEIQSRMKAELRAAIKGYGDPVVLPAL